MIFSLCALEPPGFALERFTAAIFFGNAGSRSAAMPIRIGDQCGGQIIQGCAVQLGMEGLRPEFERDGHDNGTKPEIRLLRSLASVSRKGATNAKFPLLLIPPWAEGLPSVARNVQQSSTFVPHCCGSKSSLR